MLTYSALEKNAKDLWECTVSDENNFPVLIVTRTTKKALIQWVRNHKIEVNYITKEYNAFSQKYVEIVNELESLKDTLDELKEEGEPLPLHWVRRLECLIIDRNTMQQQAAKYMKKAPKDLYKDGWDFWFKEDAELREKNYANK